MNSKLMLVAVVRKVALGVLLLLFPFIIACNGSYDNEHSKETVAVASSKVAGTPMARSNTENTRKLIKEAQVVFEVKELENRKEIIWSAVEEYQAYFVFDKTESNSYRKQHNYTIRVPSEFFNALIDKISIGIEEFDKKELVVSDVTEEYVDLESRLIAKRQVASRFAKVLEKAYEVNEILEVERQMGNIREEIERIEGRLHYLDTSTSLSVIKLSVYTENEIVLADEENAFLVNFKSGWNNFVDLLSFLLLLWPYMLIAGTVCWYFFSYKKKKKVLS